MKILVVEDENLIRESLVRNVKQLGYSQIAEAGNGFEALDRIKDFQPDIILADIKMPKMDGIQLLSEIRMQSYDCIFIIVSGYDSFEYAQSALHLGAFSYLLKPVTDRDLENTLSKSVEAVNQAKMKFENSVQNKIKALMYEKFAKEQFICELIRKNKLDFKYLKDKMDELGINLEYKYFLVVITSIDNYSDFFKDLSEEEIKIMKFSIENITCEILSESDISAYCFDMEDGQGFLLNYDDDKYKDSSINIYDLFLRVKDYIYKYMNFTVTSGVGSIADCFEKIHESYNKACKAVMSRLAKGCNQVFISDKLESSAPKTVLINLETEQKLMVGLEKCDKAEALEIIKNLYIFYNISGTNQANILTKLNFQLVCTIFKGMERIGIDLEQITGSEIKLYNYVNLCSSLDKIIEFYSKLMDTCFEQIQGMQDFWNRKLMGKAVKYIIDNYDKNISLNTVADFINISPAYFSKLFKEEYNENFIDFLVKLRIDKAQGLLKEGHTVDEVAKLTGFNDDKYLYRVFKKNTGITPGNYKKNAQE